MTATTAIARVDRNKIRWACTIAGCAALLALASWPIGVYTLTRFLVCIGATIAAVVFFSANRSRFGWLCVAIAVVFNPLIRVHFTRDTWQMIDAITGSLLLLLGWFPWPLTTKTDSVPAGSGVSPPANAAWIDTRISALEDSLRRGADTNP